MRVATVILRDCLREPRLILSTKPALERILTQNASIQAKNTTNNHPIEAAEAEGLGNSNAVAEAQNNKQQMEYFVDAEFPTPPICWTVESREK